MEVAKLFFSGFAVLLSCASFLIALRTSVRARKAEAIRNLLGEKETVAYAALRLMRDGLPNDGKDRQLVLEAVAQACVFERSDRARALLYHVIDQNRAVHRAELESAVELIKTTFDQVAQYNFTKEQLELSTGRRLLAALNQVVEGPRKA